MSRSKALGGGKAKAKAKKAAARTKSAPVLETLRVIEAATEPAGPEVPLSAGELALNARVVALAAEIEQAVRTADRTGVLQPAAVQAMLAALCRVYSGHVENGVSYGAFSQQNPVTPTDVMVTASGLLKAANLAVFELGMWQSWTGR
jgi:hypothetical protein